MFLGPLNKKWTWLPDLTWRERIMLYPLAAMAIFFGLAPGTVFSLVNPTLFKMIDQINHIATQIAMR